MSEPRYVIWSEEHLAWWKPGRAGYTRYLADAGRYSEDEAKEIVADANKYLAQGSFNEVAIPDPLP